MENIDLVIARVVEIDFSQIFDLRWVKFKGNRFVYNGILLCLKSQILIFMVIIN